MGGGTGRGERETSRVRPCCYVRRLGTNTRRFLIPPCQVAATNMSAANKHSERVMERREKLCTKTHTHKKKQVVHKETETKATPKEKSLKKSLVKAFLFFFFYRKPPHVTERRSDVFSPGNRERSCAIPRGGGVVSPLYDAPRAALLTEPNASMEQIKC